MVSYLRTQQVFDVNLDGNTIISGLDIFSQVGYAAAHDEHIPFTVKNGQLSVNGGTGTSASMHPQCWAV